MDGSEESSDSGGRSVSKLNPLQFDRHKVQLQMILNPILAEDYRDK